MQSAEIERQSLLKQKDAPAAAKLGHYPEKQVMMTKVCPYSNTNTAPSQAPPKNLLRELLDSKPTALDGFLSYKHGLCAPRPLDQLQHQYSLWESWAKKLPQLYRTGKYQEYFQSQPILTVEKLSDKDLLRANQILGLCAHAVVHFTEKEVHLEQSHDSDPTTIQSNQTCPFKPLQQQQQCPFKPQSQKTVTEKKRSKEHCIPPAIYLPWIQVNQRLGRPKPTFTYYDYFTLNVVPKNGNRSEPLNGVDIYHTLQCDVQVFGDASENVFVIMNHDMEYQSTPLISLACDAVDCILDNKDDKLVEILHAMSNVVQKVTQAFLHAEPNSYSEFYCDPVSWSKSIGMLIPPILDGEMSMSGLQSSFTHLMDVLIGRYDYGGELGTLALEERPWLPSLHQEFFCRLNKCSIRSYVRNSHNRALHGSFNRLVRLFVHGFLEAHRLKICGFLELGIKTGRTESSGQTAQAVTGWQSRAWRKVNDDCLYSIAEREQLLIHPRSNGFVGALVESITEQAPGSESYKVVFDISGSGIRYQAGDRVEILPSNRDEMVTRMLDVLGVSGDLEVTIDTPVWKAAVEQHCANSTRQTAFPLVSVLKIMSLRPLTKETFDNLCDLVGAADRRTLEQEFQAGRIDDVPDLLELLLAQVENTEMVDAFVKNICAVLPPLDPRHYSIANSPDRQDGMQSKVSIVISRLWYNVESSSKRKNSWILGGSNGDRLGVCTSFLLNDSLRQYVPLRIVEEERFHLPDQDDTGSIIMIALGSGAAPMFAFIEELLARGRDSCPEVFFCWGLASSTNLFGLPLLERAVREIGLKVCISFSREENTVKIEDGKILVIPGRQERITTTLSKDQWPCTVSRLAKGDGTFYLCGHPMLANTVRGVIEHALCTSGGLSIDESSEKYVRMVAAKRVRSDLYYSGSLHDVGLPAFSAAEVARHNELDDMWWIYKVGHIEQNTYAFAHGLLLESHMFFFCVLRTTCTT